MTVEELADLGRQALARKEWAAGYADLHAARLRGDISAEDLRELARAAFLLGRDDEGCQLFDEAYHAFEIAGDPEQAGRCAFWVGFSLLNRGHQAEAGGWLARAQRIADEQPGSGVLGGYVTIPHAMRALYTGAPEAALEAFAGALSTGEHCGDKDLIALATVGMGEAMARQGRVAAGIALLDELMLSMGDGTVSEIPTGIVYCVVVGLCEERFDVGRAAEWTAALDRWRRQQPDLVAFRAECQVHRSQVLQRRGSWEEAVTEAEGALARLTGADDAATGMAWYQLAELHRVRGDLLAAEEAYRRAHESGLEPQPGLALLRLAQGRPDVAATAMRRALAEAPDAVARCRLLPAAVEVLLAAGDLDGARRVAEELTQHAADQAATPYLVAVAATARGSVLLADGRATAAAGELRLALETCLTLGLAHEAGRVELKLARARMAAGDVEAAQLDLDRARRTFERLGAGTDLAAADELAVRLGAADGEPGGLTAREVEVLRLVATGRTNRAVAGELHLSEKTVARHLSNIFTKLDLPSRAAATAYAYEHRLV
ncbi:LuxR C-terminal-related transcriptional regulator [Georgenia sp. M64]|uniref:LuxR C-terminal-related transcriptional regulator n=1 Tax=Georgenia sp. M64 TaxID=3120520 RepID=UPI0030DFF7F6